MQRKNPQLANAGKPLIPGKVRTAVGRLGQFCVLTLLLNGDLASIHPARSEEDSQTQSSEKFVHLRLLGRYVHSKGRIGASEIAAHDPRRQRLLVTNGAESRVDFLDCRDPHRLSYVESISSAKLGGAPTSVAVHHDLIAVAIPALQRQEPGTVALYRPDGELLQTIPVGPLPDMLRFSSDGRCLLVVNEGEPSDDGRIDPPGSVSLITVQDSSGSIVVKSSLLRFPLTGEQENPASAMCGPRHARGTVSLEQDLEPEYIAVDARGEFAWVTLQENNAIAQIDLRQPAITKIVGLGTKDLSRSGCGIDANDRDHEARIANWPVQALYQPDGIATFESNGKTYLITANEGDARQYSGFTDQARVAKLPLDPKRFSNLRELQSAKGLGRLCVSTVDGDDDQDGLFEKLVTFGGRSFAIWDADLNLLYDSGDLLEQWTGRELPGVFNSNGTQETFDQRSDDRGPEPEGVAMAQVFGRTIAIVGLERTSALAVIDVSDPHRPVPQSLWHSSSTLEKGAAQDLGPEGLLVIPAEQSPTGAPLLVVCFEASGSTCVYEFALRRKAG